MRLSLIYVVLFNGTINAVPLCYSRLPSREASTSAHQALDLIECISENLAEFDSSQNVKNYIKKFSIYCT